METAIGPGIEACEAHHIGKDLGGDVTALFFLKLYHAEDDDPASEGDGAYFKKE